LAQKPKTNANVREVIDRSDIVAVATALGLKLENKDSRPRKAICPFHDDRSPSLNLYQRAQERDNFHCFACGAHGDIVSLVQLQLNLGFWDAVKWLAPHAGVTLAETSGLPAVDRGSGSARFAERLRADSDEAELARVAERRGFSLELLRAVGAGVFDMEPLRREAARDPVILEALRDAGIVRPETIVGADDAERRWLRGFYRDKRVVFPLGAVGGVPAGFAARALDGEEPRYLYSFDFPRRDTLYGAERVETALRSPERRGTPARVYIVEGLFDQLRLESLGFDAVALLGSRAAPGQLRALRHLVDLAAQADRPLHLRLFLDPDAAGRSGAYDLTVELMRMLDRGAVFGIEIIAPPPLDDKADPDAYLKGQVPVDAEAMLNEIAFSPLDFMLGFRIGETRLPVDLTQLTSVQLAGSARRIAKSLPDVSWDRILIPLGVSEALAGFAAMIQSYGDGTPAEPQPLVDSRAESGDPRAGLISALTIGRSSTQRREYPLDDDAWERLGVAASPLYHIHRERLATGDGPMAPLLARYLPKGGGRNRLKAGPVAADALVQQYALIELLRDRPGASDFSNRIPAIRYDRRAEGKGLYRTGRDGECEALSFAYQVDMGIVNGEAPPAREGIFRPYFECWRAFIDHLDTKIRHFRHEDLQILRLDITGFYEHVRRDVIGDALQGPLEEALAQLGEAHGGPLGFAPLLRPDAGASAEERAHVFTDFLLRHAFHCDHAHPVTGKPHQLAGLPQGPDLSAYLANISLFDLDEMMRAEVARIDAFHDEDDRDGLSGEGSDTAADRAGARKCSAAYARYVDDIIIICPDADVAGLLRRKIETHLQLRGLSLNRKNPTPPRMTREEAREWLTDSRMGFGFSGPLADMPITDTMDPLADAGDIDRRTALGLLFDPELDDLRKADRIISRVERAFHAPEIRFGDRANAYRRLWLLAAQDGPTAEDIANTFRNDALHVDIGARLADDRSDIALAAIEAIERALRAHIPEVIDEDAREYWGGRRIGLAGAVLDDLFGPMARAFLGEGAHRFLARYDVRSQIAIIACLALTVRQEAGIRPSDRPFAALEAYIAPGLGSAERLPEGLRLSLFRHDAGLDPGLAALTIPSDHQIHSAFYRLESALVVLQRFGGGGADLSPAPPAGPAAIGIERMVSDILGIWAPGMVDADRPIAMIEVDAAATLINVGHRRFADIAAARPRLLRMIAGRRETQALPSPPGLETSGVMLWCNTGKLLFAAVGEGAPLPVGAQWHGEAIAEEGLAANEHGHLRLWKADLEPGARPLFDLERSWDAGEIASIYTAGHGTYFDLFPPDAEMVPVPTVFSFFGMLGEAGAIDLSSVRLICWTAPRGAVDGHAFVRSGSALEARSVHLLGADHWRYGWAVRDLCSRPEGPAEDIDGLEGHGDTKLDRAGHRRDAILARVLPRLSGADRWGPGEVRDATKIPTRIARALRLLTAFGQTELPEQQATYLVAATAEGVFMSERLATASDVGHSGRAAAIAARAARRVSRALPAAGRLWPDAAVAMSPGRRSAAAWFAVARRVDGRLDNLEKAAVVPLEALSIGMTLLGATAELRALAFELASALPAGSLERLQRLPIDLSFVMPHLGAEIALIDDPQRPDGDAGTQMRYMLRTFGEIVEGRRSAAAAARDAITPLGWLLLVATLLQITPPAAAASEDNRPVLWRMTLEGLDQARAAIDGLLPFLAASLAGDADKADWPWEIFGPLRAALPAALGDHLASLSEAAAIRIEAMHSPVNPRTGEVFEGRPVLRLADGSSHRLSEWQLDVAFVPGERRLSTECEQIGSSVHYRYSVAWNNDRVVGLHLTSQSLAEVAFNLGSGAEAEGASPVDATQSNLPGPATVPEEPPEHPVAPPEVPAHTRSGAEISGDDSRLVLSEQRPAVAQKRSGNGDKSALAPIDSMARIRQWQDSLWRDRTKRGHGLQRIALVQWDVVDTYHAPGHQGGKHEGLRKLDGTKADAKLVNAGGHFQSVVEARRRAILREVLRGCARFGVDGLVLPEYSVRPETVNWLSRRIAAMNLPLTVWCGTFRVPDGAAISTAIPSEGASPYFQPVTPEAPGAFEWETHSAMLTCIDAVKSQGGMRIRCTMRRKRYPSAAAGEAIRPAAKEVWQPLLADEKDTFRLGTYTVDLVCSEMFLHASSANLVGILEENRALASRYAMVWSETDAIDALNNDMHVFARWTSYRSVVEPAVLSRGKAMQRTLVILPAMTSRSADYHIFGQNQYLAAGLVTVFCNAVELTGSVGGSAFIGLDGWKAGAETATPYGSLAPGIYQLGSKHSNALGTREAAMVIADIDPIRTTDLKPRPHYQSRSLQLVAHLPLLFATEVDPAPQARGSRERMARKRFVAGAQQSFIEAASAVQQILDAPDPSWRHERAQADVDPAIEAILQKTVAALDMLVEFADDGDWLRRRAEAFREKRWHYSPPMVLPALTDWLYVDDNWLEEAVELGDRHPLEADENVLDVPRNCGTSKFEA